MILPLTEISVLRETLTRLHQEHPHQTKFIQNPGNAGDALISSGTWQIFDHLNIQPQERRNSDITRGDFVVCSGGGNLMGAYYDTAQTLQKCLDVGVAAVVLLPHTIRDNDDLIGRLDSRFHLFCRDQVSYNYLANTHTQANIYLSHDMALFLDVDELLERSNNLARARFLASGDNKLQKLRNYLYWLKNVQILKHHKNPEVLRTDIESTSDSSSTPDISSKYCSDFTSRLETDIISGDLLRLTNHFDEITTNRLHLGIAAGLMGKRVKFKDNNYGKIGSIFNNSLAGTHLFQMT